MATFTFDLVSPERTLFSGAVESVIVPGSEGEFQVFAGHTPVVAMLKPGVLTIDSGSGKERLFVRGGFAEVNNASLTVLAEHAVALSELKADKLAADIKDAEEDLADAKTDAERHKAETTLEVLRDLLRAASN